MATKKSASKKSTPSTKKAVARKTPVKKTKSSRPAQLKSFKASKDTEDFMSVRVNSQTFMWLIIGVLVIAFALWITKVQQDINDIYDQIDASQLQDSSLMLPPAENDQEMPDSTDAPEPTENPETPAE